MIDHKSNVGATVRESTGGSDVRHRDAAATSADQWSGGENPRSKATRGTQMLPKAAPDQSLTGLTPDQTRDLGCRRLSDFVSGP
jgi:hypothetical protein